MTRDATAVSLDLEVEQAKAALVELCKQDPERTWRAYELRAQARNGWSSGAMNLALNRLVDEGTLAAHGDEISLS